MDGSKRTRDDRSAQAPLSRLPILVTCFCVTRTENRKVKMNTTDNGITIQTMCYGCQALTELCPDCQEQKDARDSFNAHQIVDESDDYVVIGYGVRKRTVANGGAVSEFNPMSVLRDLPSGHDWTERDGELLEPTAMLVDRLYDLETSVTVTANEVVCGSCHLTHNKSIDCPICY
jgi:hypothetical protein